MGTVCKKAPSASPRWTTLMGDDGGEQPSQSQTNTEHVRVSIADVQKNCEKGDVYGGITSREISRPPGVRQTGSPSTRYFSVKEFESVWHQIPSRRQSHPIFAYHISPSLVLSKLQVFCITQARHETHGACLPPSVDAWICRRASAPTTDPPSSSWRRRHRHKFRATVAAAA